METVSDVISDKFVEPVIYNKCVTFCDPHLNCSREILPEDVGGDIFGRLSNVVEDPTGMHVHVKFDVLPPFMTDGRHRHT